MKNKNYNTQGIIGTIAFHALLVACFLLFGFSTPLPLPEEEGIEVNLGYSDDGMGDVQPEDPASMQSTNATSANDNYNLSQNTEESATLNTNPNRTNHQPETNPVNTNIAYTGRNNTQGGSEGVTGRPGDQGNPNGNPNATNHYGTPGHGISFKLDGRKSKSLPKPNYNSREEGIVVVEIWVDRAGNVIKAVPGGRGSTTTNQVLYKLAYEAALRSKFEAKDNTIEQKGTITYNFVNLN